MSARNPHVLSELRRRSRLRASLVAEIDAEFPHWDRIWSFCMKWERAPADFRPYSAATHPLSWAAEGVLDRLYEDGYEVTTADRATFRTAFDKALANFDADVAAHGGPGRLTATEPDEDEPRNAAGALRSALAWLDAEVSA